MFLLLLLLTQSVLALFFTYFRLNAIHQQNWHHLDDKDLVSMIISINDFEKMKLNERELKINGKVFDIKGKTSVKDGYELVLKYDEEEQSLLEHINKIFSPPNSSSSNSAAQINPLFALQFFEQHTPFQFGSYGYIRELNHQITMALSLVTPELNTPPPKAIFIA